MKNTNKIIFLLIGLISIYACSNKKNNTRSGIGSIKVTWELLSNTDNETPQSKQIITIMNTGNEVLTSGNWALFYNQTPREVLGVDEKSPANLERLDGDWYRIKLKDDFTLNPGDEISIDYIVSHWHIKETDSPKGLYSVFYNDKGDENKIEVVDDFEILPFTSREQIARHRNDKLPFPTNEIQYRKNLGVSLVPDSELPAIIPQPLNFIKQEGTSTLTNDYLIVASGELQNEAEYLSHQLEKITNSKFTVLGKIESERKIRLLVDSEIQSQEGYSLSIKKGIIEIHGGSKAGVFYGVQSFLNYIPLKYYKTPSANIDLNNIEVNDFPRFDYRGLHLDVARNFQTKEEVFKVLDIMAFYKLNALHFYLTEDEGWRLEIEELPELTSVGSNRSHTFDERNSLHPAYGSGPFADLNTSHGTGYYSRQDYIEILKYANERHIQVIPSINFPGHARAAVVSMEARFRNLYEQGKFDEADKYRLIHPDDSSLYSSVQYYTDNVVDVGLESTYRFFETVVDDVIEIYNEAGVKLEMIHTGGDEVPDGVWAGSPACAELMKKHREITDPKNLQQYFFKRISGILKERNLIVSGWEEIALTKTKSGRYEVNPEFFDENVVPYVWNNLGDAFDLTHRMANAGYPVIYCGVTNLYFDMAYNNHPLEPGYYWGGFVNERTVWELSPFNLFNSITHDALGHPITEVVDIEKMESLKPEARKNIIGLQAELWSETVKGGEMLEYYLLPKLLSFAERAWSQEAIWENEVNPEIRQVKMDNEWNIFINSLAQKELPRLNYLFDGYNYRVPSPGAKIVDGLLYVNHEYPGMSVYYTFDGTEPTIESLVYSDPIQISETTKLKAIDKEGKGSRTITIMP